MDIGATGYDNLAGSGRIDGLAAANTTLATLGDVDRDQDVDGRDFLLWQRTVGATATPVGSGADGDLNGTVGAGDLAIWQDHYGETIPGPLVAASKSEQLGGYINH